MKVLVGTFNNVNEYCSRKIPFTALVTNTTTLDISISDKHTKHNNLTSTSYTCTECLPKLCLASTTNSLAQLDATHRRPDFNNLTTHKTSTSQLPIARAPLISDPLRILIFQVQPSGETLRPIFKTNCVIIMDKWIEKAMR